MRALTITKHTFSGEMAKAGDSLPEIRSLGACWIAMMLSQIRNLHGASASSWLGRVPEPWVDLHQLRPRCPLL
jgi:hypothetical protein